MNKSGLVAVFGQRHPQYLVKDAEDAVRTILDAIVQSLRAGNRVEIRGFGTFRLNYRPPRVGRNPRSGQQVRVPGKAVPHFRVEKELGESIVK